MRGSYGRSEVLCGDRYLHTDSGMVEQTQQVRHTHCMCVRERESSALKSHTVCVCETVCERGSEMTLK